MTAGVLDECAQTELVWRPSDERRYSACALFWGALGPAPAALVRTGEKAASIDISRPLKRGRLATSGAPSLPAYTAMVAATAPWMERRPGRPCPTGRRRPRGGCWQGPRSSMAVLARRAATGPARGRRGQCQAPPRSPGAPVNTRRAPSRDRASRWHSRRMCGHGRLQRPSAPMFRLRWHHDQKRAFHGQLPL